MSSKSMSKIRLFKNGFDATNTSRAGLFFFNFEMAEDTGVFNMGAATNFARNWIFKIADSVDSEPFGIFVPEFAVGFKGVTSISFVIFAINDWQICRDPFIHLLFDLS